MNTQRLRNNTLMKDIIIGLLEDSLRTKETFIRSHVDLIINTADAISTCLASGHKVLIFGNGGSAADAQHLAAEFVNRFQIERPPLAAIALTTDTSVITSIGNDYHFNDIFDKQIKAFGKQGDIAWGISTSGNSPNVVAALTTARAMNIQTIGMTGDGGGKMADLCDMLFAVSSKTTARIQETHITLGHMLCDLVEKKLYPDA